MTTVDIQNYFSGQVLRRMGLGHSLHEFSSPQILSIWIRVFGLFAFIIV